MCSSADSQQLQFSSNKATGHTSEPLQTGFTFIQVEDNHGSRSAARSHVMRQYWRDKKLQTGGKTGASRKQEPMSLRPKGLKHGSGRRNGPKQSRSLVSDDRADLQDLVINESPQSSNDSSYSTTSDHESSTDEEDISQHVRSHNYAIVPLSRTAIAEVDPFTRFKFTDTPEMRKLLHHSSCMDKEAASVDFARVGWLFSRVMILDPDPYNVVVGFTIHHMSRLHGREEPAVAIKHKIEGMRLINARLGDPEEAISDGNIGAVANFTSHELLSGAPEDFAIHMAGLDQIVSARGGLLAFNNNRPLQLVIESLDLCRAYIRFQKPTYSAYDKNLTEMLARLGWTEPETFENEVFRMQTRNGFCADFIKLIDGLEKATGVIRNTASRGLYQEQWDSFRSYICSAAMQTGWATAAEEPVDDVRTTIRRCFRLASLAYIRMALQEFRSTTPLDGKYFRACKYRLLDNTTEWGRAIEMLARVILRGERSTVERHRRAWYVANAMLSLQDFGLETWKIAEVTLLGYLGLSEGAAVENQLSDGMTLPSILILQSS
ncbi:tachykinin family protein [Rutstroemia sp. NJR-2017a BVV2]|nr:tachykinin family protein [Rutstroemia sp. NJR-2017a BVV2]